MKRLVKANKLGELIYEYKNGMKEYLTLVKKQLLEIIVTQP